MIERLRERVPLVIGFGTVILILDGFILALHRLVGLDKGTALYVSILILAVAGYVLMPRAFANPAGESADLGEG